MTTKEKIQREIQIGEKLELLWGVKPDPEGGIICDYWDGFTKEWVATGSPHKHHRVIMVDGVEFHVHFKKWIENESLRAEWTVQGNGMEKTVEYFPGLCTLKDSDFNL